MKAKRVPLNLLVDEENKRKTVFVLSGKGETLTSMINKQLEKYAKEFDKKNNS